MIFSTPTHFTPGTKNINPLPTKAFWFLFRKNELLVVQNNIAEGVDVPYTSNLNDIGVSIEVSQFIGHHEGKPCYTAEISEKTETSDIFFWSGLRALFGQINDELFSISGRALQITDWYRSHQYCGRCGTRNNLKDGERCLACPSCEQLHYPRLAPAMMVMIQKEKEFLLARSPHFLAGMYSALAGFSEPGETLEETVHREVYEEVGIRITNLRYFSSQPWPFPHSLMIAFHADYKSGEIDIDPKEIEDARWFNINELPERLPSTISIARKLIDATLGKLRNM